MKKSNISTPFLDLLFNCLVGFVFLFIIAFLLIAPEKKEAGIKTKAEFVITMTWELDSPDDVDIWIRDPLQKIMYFRRKEVNFMHLDRDDRGNVTDHIYVNDKLVEYPYNQEIVTLRGFIPGEWIINLHMYSKRCEKPAEVMLRIDKINPNLQTIFLETFTLTNVGQEITATRFIMSQDDIISWSKLHYGLISANLIRNTVNE